MTQRDVQRTTIQCIGVHGRACTDEAVRGTCFCDACNKEYIAACRKAGALAKERTSARMAGYQKSMQEALDGRY